MTPHNLGHWVSHQRVAYAQGLLSQSEIDSDEAIPGWTWNVLETRWKANLAKLVAFVEKNDRLPRQKEMSWVSNQRISYKAGGLTQAQRTSLEAVPGWVWELEENKTWDTMYSVLLDAVIRTGSIPKEFTTWTVNQRTDYRNRNLSQDRTEKLELIPGWTWKTNKELAWDRSFNKLLSFLATNGRLPSASEMQWQQEQRAGYAKGKVSKVHVELLESVPGWTWTPRKDYWNKRFNELVGFIEREGRIPTVKEMAWVNTQRSEFFKGAMSQEKIERLESVRLWAWNVDDTKWQNALGDLRAFVSEHDRLPYQSENPWITSQRTAYAKKSLSGDQIRQIETVPGWTWVPREDRWARNVGAYLAFHNREGHGLVPAKHVEGGINLGRWVSGCRGAYRKDLSRERLNQVDSLPGWVGNVKESPFKEGDTRE